jgi:hypothetical protein
MSIASTWAPWTPGFLLSCAVSVRRPSLHLLVVDHGDDHRVDRGRPPPHISAFCPAPPLPFPRSSAKIWGVPGAAELGGGGARGVAVLHLLVFSTSTSPVCRGVCMPRAPTRAGAALDANAAPSGTPMYHARMRRMRPHYVGRRSEQVPVAGPDKAEVLAVVATAARGDGIAAFGKVASKARALGKESNRRCLAAAATARRLFVAERGPGRQPGCRGCGLLSPSGQRPRGAPPGLNGFGDEGDGDGGDPGTEEGSDPTGQYD